MKRHRSHLVSNVQVAAPCHASWDKMDGDERARLCQDCKLHVYNLSEMTSREIENLVLEKEGKLCVRFLRREDGTILTQDCPVGLRRIRARVQAFRALAVCFVAWLLSICRGNAEELSPSSSKEKITATKSTLTDCSDDLLVVLQKPAQKVGCEPCTPLGSEELMVFADQATMFSQSGKCLNLQNGKLIVLTEKEPVQVDCKFGKILLPADCGAILEIKDSWKYIRIANLIGRYINLVVDTGDGRQVTYPVGEGEEICITSRDLYAELRNHLVPNDGVKRSEWTMGLFFWPGIRNSIDRESMIEKEPLLNCNDKSPVRVRQWISNMHKRIFEEKKKS